MDRKLKLLKIITAENKVSVADLAIKLDVSQVTIRKYLDELVAKGLAKREHGFAVALDNDDLSYRLAHNYSIKSKIAQAAAKDISDGEILMIESGSTSALFAEVIAKTKNGVRIITNSVFIANYIRDYKNIAITLLGGDFQGSAQVNTGPLTTLAAEQFSVDKLFLGTDGFDPKQGFSSVNHLRADTVKQMAKSANQVIILSDSEKFSQRALVKLFAIDEVAMVYTDKGIDNASQLALRQAGVIVEVVE